MSTLTRRAALAAIVAMPTGPALASNETAKNYVADDEWSHLRNFLETATSAELLHYHMARAADAVNELRPGAWRVELGLNHGVVLMIDDDLTARQRAKAEAGL